MPTNKDMKVPFAMAMKVKTGTSVHRTGWTELKSRAAKAGADTKKFNKDLGPACDLFEQMYKASLVTTDPTNDVLRALTLQQKKIEDICKSYSSLCLDLKKQAEAAPKLDKTGKDPRIKALDLLQAKLTVFVTENRKRVKTAQTTLAARP